MERALLRPVIVFVSDRSKRTFSRYFITAVINSRDFLLKKWHAMKEASATDLGPRGSVVAYVGFVGGNTLKRGLNIWKPE